MEVISRIFRYTLCRLGRHCHAKRTEVKWNGGRIAHLCRHCRLILWNEY